MADKDDNDNEGLGGIYRVQTVPPPPGESDAYSAPTKVGPMASAVINELIEQARLRGGVVETMSEGAKKGPRTESDDDDPPVAPQRAAPVPLPRVAKSTDIASTRKVPSAKIPAVAPAVVIPQPVKSIGIAEPIAPAEPITPVPAPQIVEVSPPPSEPAKPADSPPQIVVFDPNEVASAALAERVAPLLEEVRLSPSSMMDAPSPSTPNVPPHVAPPPSQPHPVTSHPVTTPISSPMTPFAMPAEPMLTPSAAPSRPSRVRAVVLMFVLLALLVVAARLLLLPR